MKLKRSTKNPNKIVQKCPECASTLAIEEGAIICTQDLLGSEYPMIFREWDCLPPKDLKKILEAASSITREMYDRWNIQDKNGDRIGFECQYNPMIDFNPMTQSKVWLPDPVQQVIAERLLKRPLTAEEYWGEKKVPLINQEGERFKGFIKQLEFPRDVSCEYKDMVEIYCDEPMPVVISWEDMEDFDE